MYSESYKHALAYPRLCKRNWRRNIFRIVYKFYHNIGRKRAFERKGEKEREKVKCCRFYSVLPLIPQAQRPASSFSDRSPLTSSSAFFPHRASGFFDGQVKSPGIFLSYDLTFRNRLGTYTMPFFTRNINFRLFIYPKGIYYELNVIRILNNLNFRSFKIANGRSQSDDIIQIFG